MDVWADEGLQKKPMSPASPTVSKDPGFLLATVQSSRPALSQETLL